MVRQYTPAIRFANSGSSSAKSFQYVQTLEQTRQCVSDHDVQHDHFSGVVRYARDWRFHNVIYYLFNPVPAKANPPISIPSSPAYVNLTGSNFTPGCMVYLDDVLATPTGATYIDENHISFQSPLWPGEEAHVMVKVTRPDMRTGSNGNIFGYENVPIITLIAPTSGYVDGGEPVVVQGFYLKDGSVVVFSSGTSILTSSQVAFFNSHVVTALTPKATYTGSYSVAIISPSGLQSSPATQLFSYIYHPPVITSVTPVSLTTDGGQTVTVRGTHFLSGAHISLTQVVMTSSVWISDTQMQFITPAHASGTASVRVRNPDTNDSNAVDVTFVPGLPTITYISPTLGSSGTLLQLRGTHLSSSMNAEKITAVMFQPVSHSGTVYSTNDFNFVSPVSGSVRMRTMTPGAYYVMVVSPIGNGSSEASLLSVTYQTLPTIAAINPSQGGIAGNYYAYLTGSNFLTTSVVTVDGQVVPYNVLGAPASAYNYARIVMPPHAAGQVTVTITNNGLFSGSINFTYSAVPDILSGSTWRPDTT